MKLGVTESDEVTGVDIDDEALVIARQRFPKRAFCAGAAENLPLVNASFDRVISNVAIPYMDIPTTLLEIHRVLAPGGQVWLSVHPASFTMGEIRKNLLSLAAASIPALCCGEWFVASLHRKDSTVREPAHRVLSDGARNEDCTPARGIINASFTRPEGPVGKRLIVQARKKD